MEYNLERFVVQQRIYFNIALQEIQNGRKQTHWMWFIFPQLRVLGSSNMAIFYGIENLEEAILYAQDDYLRGNLIEITRALLALDTCDALYVMGYPDNIKLRSCMTLFEKASPDIKEFSLVLEKFFMGERDSLTLQYIS